MVRKKLDYTWVIVAACFVMIFTGLGFCSGNKGLFLAAISETLGIPRSMYAVSDSLRYITTSVTNLFFGALVAKFGPRKLIGVGFLSLILSCFVNSLAENVIGFYLGGILLGLGLTFGGTAIVGYVVKTWCSEKRGTIMGLILCANGLGVAVSAPWFSSVIYGGDPFGYRIAYRTTALILLVVGTIVVLVLRDAPKNGSVQLAEKKSPGKSNVWEGICFADALRQPYFYIVCLCVFFNGAVLQSVSGVSAAHMKDQGLSAEFVGIVTSIHALSLAVFKFLTGVIYDKKGLKVTLLLCQSAAVVMILLLSLVTSTVHGQFIAVLYAIIVGLALPLETVMLPLIAGDLFGEKDFGKLLGILVSVNTAGFAIGPLLTNLCYDMVGSYRPVFMIYVCVMIAASIAFLAVQKQVVVIRRERSGAAAGTAEP